MSVAEHHVVITAEDNHEIVITREDHQHLLQILNRELTEATVERTHLYNLLMGLHRASVVEPEDVPRDVVTMDSVIELTGIGTHHHEVFTLVYPEFENASENMLSILTPLGVMLLGSRNGELVSSEFPDGTRRLMRIENIVYQPEHYEH